jgi:hypothetical protein
VFEAGARARICEILEAIEDPSGLWYATVEGGAACRLLEASPEEVGHGCVLWSGALEEEDEEDETEVEVAEDSLGAAGALEDSIVYDLLFQDHLLALHALERSLESAESHPLVPPWQSSALPGARAGVPLGLARAPATVAASERELAQIAADDAHALRLGERLLGSVGAPQSRWHAPPHFLRRPGGGAAGASAFAAAQRLHSLPDPLDATWEDLFALAGASSSSSALGLSLHPHLRHASAFRHLSLDDLRRSSSVGRDDPSPALPTPRLLESHNGRIAVPSHGFPVGDEHLSSGLSPGAGSLPLSMSSLRPMAFMHMSSPDSFLSGASSQISMPELRRSPFRHPTRLILNRAF